MTTDIAKDKKRNSGICSVSLVVNSEKPCLLFAGFWKNFSPQKANFEKCCSLLHSLQDCESCGIQLSTDCEWDSSLVVFLLRLQDERKDSGIILDFSGLPLKLSTLLALSSRNKPTEHDEKQISSPDISKIHSSIVLVFLQVADFLGKCLIYFFRLCGVKVFCESGIF